MLIFTATRPRGDSMMATTRNVKLCLLGENRDIVLQSLMWLRWGRSSAKMAVQLRLLCVRLSPELAVS